MLLVRDAITAARDLHPAFDKYSTPDAVALRFVARYQQAALTEIARYRADAVHAEQEIDLPLDDFAAGAEVDPHLVLHGGTLYFTDATIAPVPLVLVEYPMRLEPYLFPAAYLRPAEPQLFLLGILEDWQDVARIVLDLFPQGDDEVAMDDFLLLPGSPLNGCVDALGSFMKDRAIAQDVPVALTFGAGAESYLDEATGRKRAKVGLIREEW